MTTEADESSAAEPEVRTDPKHLICKGRNCRHPKSFHKPTGCSAFGCSCEVAPDAEAQFDKIEPGSKKS